MKTGKTIARAAIFGLAATLLLPPMATVARAASELVAVVNKTPITSNDLSKRVAFLRLQRTTGNLNSIAKQQLIDEALKREEIARVKMSVSTSDVDASFARFAASNKMNPAQLTEILSKAGVGADHFKAFIAIQMSWPRLVGARYNTGGRLSGQELITRMMERKEKPVTTEYFLQQVIFVIPESKRNSITAKRKSEAEASRSRYPGCEQAKVFAATMRDVSIRDLGRILAPELPAEWKPLIEGIKGTTTGTRVTEKGVEYLAICNQRQVSDDYAAEVVFRAEDLGKNKKGDEDPNEKKYLEELRAKARIKNP